MWLKWKHTKPLTQAEMRSPFTAQIFLFLHIFIYKKENMFPVLIFKTMAFLVDICKIVG